MADLELVRRLVAADQGLAIVGTTRSDGTIQASLVNAGVLRHPDGHHDVVGFVARGGALKLRNLRARPRASVAFRAGWEWAAVEGPATIIGPDDSAGGGGSADRRRRSRASARATNGVVSTDPERLRALLRDVFGAAGGTHDDWDEYDRVMRDERRAAVLVTPERISGNF